jgi:exodeoxyribonuclease VII large subunit
LAIQVDRRRQRVEALAQLLETLSYKSVLERGFALVRDAAGTPFRSAVGVSPGEELAIEFADGVVRAMAAGAPKAAKRKGPDPARQGTLFDA